MNRTSDTPAGPAKHWGLLIGCVLLCQAAGALGSLSTQDAATWAWYDSLHKPVFHPPDWLFAPVWITLYTLMGVALWLVVRHGQGRRLGRLAVGLFLGQLVLNAAWTPLFFGLRQIGWALVDLLLLLGLLVATVGVFVRIHRAAGLLLFPYLAWVGFAAVLNAVLWLLNR